MCARRSPWPTSRRAVRAPSRSRGWCASRRPSSTRLRGVRRQRLRPCSRAGSSAAGRLSGGSSRAASRMPSSARSSSTCAGEPTGAAGVRQPRLGRRAEPRRADADGSRHRPSAPCPGCVIAGAGRTRLVVPEGTPLAGYGSFQRRLVVPDVLDRYPHAFWFKPARPDGEALAARALVLERDGTRVVWVAVDLIAVDRAFTETVAARLLRAGTRPGVLIVSASHTHSGPGGFVDGALLSFIAADREDAVVREALVTAVVEAVRRADETRGPARVTIGVTPAPAVVRSRIAGPLDPEVVVLAVRRAAGTPVALVWNFAIHGTMLGARNLTLSADVMGATSEALEQAVGAPALFVNGAVGDVSPARHGRAALGEVASALAEAARAAWMRAVPVGAGPLLARVVRVELPPPRLSLHNCLGGWMPVAARIPLDGALPGETTPAAVALGDIAWVALPGE